MYLMNSFKYERLSPENAVLLLIDHQAGLLPLVNDWSQSELKNNVLALAKIAKIFNLPVIITSSYEQGPNGPIAPGIKEIFPDVKVIKRQGEINAWDDPNFVKAVKETGRKKLIMAGIVTDVCIAFPALSAIEAGYDVIVTDYSGGYHDAILLLIKKAVEKGVITLPKGVQLATSNPAKFIKGLAPNRGLIEPGRCADLIIVDKNDISNVKYVIIGGKVVIENGIIIS